MINKQIYKIPSSVFLGMLLLFFSIISCSPIKDEVPPYPNNGPIKVAPVIPPTPSIACGATVDGFAANTFAYNGLCYKIGKPLSASSTGSTRNFFIMGGFHDLGDGNFVQLDTYFNERIYTSQDYTTVEGIGSLDRENIFFVLTDGTNYSKTKELVSYRSTGGQKVTVAVSGLGIEVKFTDLVIEIPNVKSLKISAHLLIN